MFHLTRIFRMGPVGIWLCFRSLCFSKLFTCFERFVDKSKSSKALMRLGKCNMSLTTASNLPNAGQRLESRAASAAHRASCQSPAATRLRDHNFKTWFTIYENIIKVLRENTFSIMSILWKVYSTFEYGGWAGDQFNWISTEFSTRVSIVLWGSIFGLKFLVLNFTVLWDAL